MCEFCLKHGEGKKWYENIKNYSEDVIHKYHSEKKIKSFLNNLDRSMSQNVEKAKRWKKRFPRAYDILIYPRLTNYLKRMHFGQIVPLEDVEKILDNCQSIVRFPCLCRKVTIKENRRYCMGIGLGLSSIHKDLPDFNDFDRLSAIEAKAFVRHLGSNGNTHSVWTVGTPFIGAICNCDRNCMAYKFQMELKIAKVMWKGEYVAHINQLQCTGCKECMKFCYFRAITFDRRNIKCAVNSLQCYGCGLCKTVCQKNAVLLQDRSTVPSAANVW